MLETWTIHNFKSLRGTVDIPLGRVTALCGANSSGKSSIIHSILMMKQSVNSDQTGRHIALNGHWVKLGTFRDALTFGSTESLGIDYAFSLDDYESRGDQILGSAAPGTGRTRATRRIIRSINGQFRWSPAEEELDLGLPDADAVDRLTGLNPTLTYASTEVGVSVDGSHSSSHEALLKIVAEPFHVERSDDVDFSMYRLTSISEQLQREIDTELPSAQVESCLMSNFLPDELIVQYDKARFEARRLAAYFIPEPGRTFSSAGPVVTLPAQVFSVINAWLRDHSLEPIPQNVSHSPQRVREYILRRTGNPRQITGAPGTERRLIDFSDLRAQIEESFFQLEEQRQELQFRTPRTIREANAYVRDFFLTGVRYLGPLREEPKAVYPAEALARPDDVGVRGEHTAAVLDLNRNRQVRHLAPPGLDDDRSIVRLVESLEQWLQYLGVAINVEIKDAGKFGRQLKVRTENDGDFHDLTHVGVGVSQVLPILVMSLLAPNPCLLLFEQPELHLHPRVQARLADFFLAMGRLGRQCLLETHSEYLIDRLRFRVAESSSSDILDLIKLYFTQKNEGNTVCKSVRLTEFGSITNWPEDFFDQSSSESSRILKAASLKRTRSLRNPA